MFGNQRKSVKPLALVVREAPLSKNRVDDAALMFRE
jgi:hypothetical protein